MAKIWKSFITIMTIYSLISCFNFLLQSSEIIYPINTCSNVTNFCAALFKFQSLTTFLQVVWLKVELCRLLEEKRSAILRLLFPRCSYSNSQSFKTTWFVQPATQEVARRFIEYKWSSWRNYQPNQISFKAYPQKNSSRVSDDCANQAQNWVRK